jgi:uncharacterized Tic20 family protein
MSNNLDTTTNTHVYKPKRWTLALNVFLLGFIGIVMGIPLIMFVMMLVSFIRAESKFDTFTTLFACLLSPIIILLGFNIIQMTINVIMSFFSYIKISPDGIEQKHSPYKHIRCNWSDVDKLGKFFLFTDVIYLNSYEVIGLSLSLKSPFRFLRPKQGVISISGYDGWSDGQLANDLKQYAPKLFENQPIPQETQPQKKDSQYNDMSGTSQETRLLAALSHASVFFSYIGVLIPIGIYATQKKKSSYIGFQALQALIWQIVAFIFNMLASSCMVGAIFIPIFIAALSKNEKILELYSGGIFFLMIASVFLMTFGNLAFIIYGIIGAIMTYQGKDFRYVFIANRMEKRKGAKPTNSV